MVQFLEDVEDMELLTSVGHSLSTTTDHESLKGASFPERGHAVVSCIQS